jgi:hypothetical protein
LEALERRAVPTIISGPSVFGEKGFVTATVSEVGNQLVAVFQLDVQHAPAGYSTPVGLALYSLNLPIIHGSNPQVRVNNVQGAYPLSAAHPTETITVNEVESGNGCNQVDAYVGNASTAGPILTLGPVNDLLNSHLLAALVECKQNSGPFQGLTVGYYKNHLGAFAAVGLDPNTTLAQEFGAYGDFAPGSPYASLADVTLADALSFHGGPTLADKAQILLRQAVTALLNASSSAINYPLSAIDVLNDVHAALASHDPNVITNLASQLDSYNSAEGVDLGLPNTNH